jgi:hypothetical protein
VPGGQFALDSGQAASGKGRQDLPACGALGLLQFGLVQFRGVDSAVDVADVGRERGQVGWQRVAAFDVREGSSRSSL